MSLDEFIALLENVMEVPPGSLHQQQELDERFDSLAILGLLAALDLRGFSEIRADEIAGARSVAELYQVAFSRSSSQ